MRSALVLLLALIPQFQEPRRDVNPVSCISPAHLVEIRLPNFPRKARIARWEADKPHSVRLRALVQPDGKSNYVLIMNRVSEKDWGFEEEAVRAAKNSCYEPYRHDGKAVRGWAEFTVTFPSQAELEAADRGPRSRKK